MNTPLKHIAFIMDGNGRWAKQRGLGRTEGHTAGAQRVSDVLTRVFDHWHIPFVTLYAFSTENWKRPAYEIKAIFNLLTCYLKNNIDSFVENKIRLRVIGNLDALSKPLRTNLEMAMQQTATFDTRTLTLAINYGAREEVLQAIKSLSADELKDLQWDQLAARFYTANMPDPDLIVRTSGEQRLSNFLLLQSAYSELYFTETFWPDFDGHALDLAIESYLKRKRRFGGV